MSLESEKNHLQIIEILKQGPNLLDKLGWKFRGRRAFPRTPEQLAAYVDTRPKPPERKN
ncbi:hypothetical protein HY025_03980 [Candidatus Daviesbacteria bacterium]|nr:hypothetical protein [Candidatus Daviesbacteria bacterium]